MQCFIVKQIGFVVISLMLMHAAIAGAPEADAPSIAADPASEPEHDSERNLYASEWRQFQR